MADGAPEQRVRSVSRFCCSRRRRLRSPTTRHTRSIAISARSGRFRFDRRLRAHLDSRLAQGRPRARRDRDYGARRASHLRAHRARRRARRRDDDLAATACRPWRRRRVVFRGYQVRWMVGRSSTARSHVDGAASIGSSSIPRAGSSPWPATRASFVTRDSSRGKSSTRTGYSSARGRERTNRE